jgi:hypothetical protein
LTILRAIKWLALAAWGLLTLIVIIFLIDHFIHPHTKGISNEDLKDYGIISIPFIAVIITTVLLIKQQSKRT